MVEGGKGMREREGGLDGEVMMIEGGVGEGWKGEVEGWSIWRRVRGRRSGLIGKEDKSRDTRKRTDLFYFI